MTNNDNKDIDLEKFERFFAEMNIGYHTFVYTSENGRITDLIIDRRSTYKDASRGSLEVEFDESGKFLHFLPWGK